MLCNLCCLLSCIYCTAAMTIQSHFFISKKKLVFDLFTISYDTTNTKCHLLVYKWYLLTELLIVNNNYRYINSIYSYINSIYRYINCMYLYINGVLSMRVFQATWNILSFSAIKVITQDNIIPCSMWNNTNDHLRQNKFCSKTIIV